MSETYEEILSRMEGKFEELSGFRPDDASDIGIRLKVMAGELYSASVNLDWLKRQVFPQTAGGLYLDYHAQQRGLQRKGAVKAAGRLEFSRETAALYDVVIPEGTVCSTAGVGGVRFVTTEKGILSAGEFSVSIAAAAEEGGKNGNVASNTVLVLVTPPAGVTAVKNAAAFAGGTEEESDQELRNRVLQSYRNVPNGTNSAFYKDFALRYEGVYSASVVPKARGVGTVDVYIAGKGGAAPEELRQKIQKDLNAIKEINVDVSVKAPTTVPVTVVFYLTAKNGFVFEEVRDAAKEVLTEYVNSLTIGESLYMSKAAAAVYSQVEGVENTWAASSLSQDVSISSQQLAVVSKVTVSPVTG